MTKVSGTRHSPISTPAADSGGAARGRTERSSSTGHAVHVDGFAKAPAPNRFSSSSHNTLQGASASAATGTTSSSTSNATSAANAQFHASVSQQSTRPTVQVTAQAMTDPNSPVFKAMQAVKPPIPISNPKVGGDGIPQIKVGPVTQDQINQLKAAGFNLDTLNALSEHKGESQNYGMRDGNTLWRVGVEPAGTKDGQQQFTLGFYGETLPPGAPDGQGAIRITDGVVIRAGGDTPVGEPPSLANKAFNAVYEALSGWFPPAG